MVLKQPLPWVCEGIAQGVRMTNSAEYVVALEDICWGTGSSSCCVTIVMEGCEQEFIDNDVSIDRWNSHGKKDTMRENPKVIVRMRTRMWEVDYELSLPLHTMKGRPR